MPLRRFYEALPFGHRTNRVAYVSKDTSLPTASAGAEWTEDKTFRPGEAILENQGLKDVYATAIKDGCAIVDGRS